MPHTSDFSYELPEELIAQNPPEHRDGGRMLVLNAVTGACEIRAFTDIVDYFRAGDCIAVNDTRVIRARLFARRETGGKIEIMLLRPGSEADCWVCFLKPGRRAPVGEVLSLLDREDRDTPVRLEVLAKEPSGECSVRFLNGGGVDLVEKYGHVPLPPYIKRQNQAPDAERYQTVYAVHPGAVAAPTAGLHFTEDIFQRLQAKGVAKTALTLHVGQGTFKPVSVENVEEHKMHSEEFIFTEECAEVLNRTRASGGRIAAVGTTTLRVLESCVNPDRTFSPKSGATDIFIYPPYQVLSADMLLTNFHLPQSTLLMLVCAYAGFDNIMNAYRLAVRERMKFFSYGECMLIIRKPL